MEPINQAAGLDTVTITLIGGLVVTIIGVIVSGIIQIITALRLTAVAKDTEAIKGHVNSEQTAAHGRQALLENENKLLREMLTDKRQTAGLLAQAAAVAPHAAGTQAPAVLMKIETNTAETAANTERTEAKLDDIKEDKK